MTFRAGLDDDAQLKQLIADWTDGQADIDSRILAIRHRMDRILLGKESSFDPALVLSRLRVEANRLDELANVADAILDDLTQATGRFIGLGQAGDVNGGVARIYAAGAARSGLDFAWLLPHRAATAVLAQDLFDDVLAMTSFVEDDAKRWVRRVSRRLTVLKLTSGVPVVTQARRFRNELAAEFRSRGIGSVVYRDGSRHGFGEYAAMLLRTKTGMVYNQGTLNQGRLAGIRFYEILDGALCGLTSHHDPELANGKIVPFEVAAAFPLAHPNCRRSINPRPDVNKSNLDQAVSVQSPEARRDQAAFEEALRQQGARRGAQSRSGARRRPRRPSRPQRPRRPARGAQRPAERPPAPPPPPPERLGTLDTTKARLESDLGKRYLGGAKPGEVVRVAKGPKAASVPGEQPGKGLAMIDDKDRLFFVEVPREGRNAERLAELRLREMAQEVKVSTPEGIRGAPVHMRVAGRSTDDAVWSRRYGTDFYSAANANRYRVVHFNGKTVKGTIWHENGHTLAYEVNEILEDRLRQLQPLFNGHPEFYEARSRIFQVFDTSVPVDDRRELLRSWGVRNWKTIPFGESDKVENAVRSALRREIDKANPEFANLRRFYGGDASGTIVSGAGGPAPGEAWLAAGRSDVRHLRKTSPDAHTSELEGNTKVISRTGREKFENQPTREGVTRYAASTAGGIEDFAEGWRLFIVDRRHGYIAEDFFRPDQRYTFEDLFPARARYFEELADALGIELPPRGAPT